MLAARLLAVASLLVAAVSAAQIGYIYTPVKGVRWPRSSSQLIEWTASGVARVKIQYGTPTTLWNLVVNNLPTDALGSYTWSIPSNADLSAYTYIRISSASDSSVYRETSFFEIVPAGNPRNDPFRHLVSDWATCFVRMQARSRSPPSSPRTPASNGPAVVACDPVDHDRLDPERADPLHALAVLGLGAHHGGRAQHRERRHLHVDRAGHRRAHRHHVRPRDERRRVRAAVERLL
jgi:hypothetical protein